MKYCAYSIAQLWGREKYWRTVFLERMVGKYLANIHLNKTICTYIINNYCSEALKIQYLKRSARRGTSPSFTHV